MTITRSDWTSALRSGHYTQIQGAMANDYGYCCLGVACELAGVECDDLTDGHELTFIGTYDRTLPTALGINDDDMIELALMNDTGASFNRIANFIDNMKFNDDVLVDEYGYAR